MTCAESRLKFNLLFNNISLKSLPIANKGKLKKGNNKAKTEIGLSRFVAMVTNCTFNGVDFEVARSIFSEKQFLVAETQLESISHWQLFTFLQNLTPLFAVPHENPAASIELNF